MLREFPIVQFEAIENNRCLEFVVYQLGRPYYAFLVKQQDNFYAYANSCPHQGRMLQWRENEFLTKDRSRIMCGAHGATFEIQSGHCDAGPCKGASLTGLSVRIVNQVVMVSFADQSDKT